MEDNPPASFSLSSSPLTFGGGRRVGGGGRDLRSFADLLDLRSALCLSSSSSTSSTSSFIIRSLSCVFTFLVYFSSFVWRKNNSRGKLSFFTLQPHRHPDGWSSCPCQHQDRRRSLELLTVQFKGARGSARWKERKKKKEKERKKSKPSAPGAHHDHAGDGRRSFLPFLPLSHSVLGAHRSCQNVQNVHRCFQSCPSCPSFAAAAGARRGTPWELAASRAPMCWPRSQSAVWAHVLVDKSWEKRRKEEEEKRKEKKLPSKMTALYLSMEACAAAGVAKVISAWPVDLPSRS